MEYVKTVKELRDLLMRYPGDIPITVGVDRFYQNEIGLMGVEPILDDPFTTEEERAEDLDLLQRAEQNDAVYVETPHVFPRVTLWVALPHED
jgi:hypothetical protein